MRRSTNARVTLLIVLILSLVLCGCSAPTDGEHRTARLTRVIYIGGDEGYQAEFTLGNGQNWAGPYPTFEAPTEMRSGDSIDMGRQKVDVVFGQGKWTVTGPVD